MKKIVILGTGGNCIDILDTIVTINLSSPRYSFLGFLDDNEQALNSTVMGHKVLGKLSYACELSDDVFFINGIGSPNNFWRKEDIINSCGLSDDRFESIIHPSASISNFAQLGVGCVVLQQAVIASNARVGKHVMILPGAVISHDCNVGDYSSIASGVCISGNAYISRCCYLGANSCIIGGVTIGSNSLIGMGSTVLGDVEANSVMVGCPSRFLRRTF
jgi:sugar O-acyltransferase (sialic acid O-acetyltransferase NeuD family)